MVSTCTGCKSTFGFEAMVIEPRGSNYKLIAIQCVSCGGVAGITEYRNAGVLIGDLAKEVKKLRAELATVDHNLRQVASALSRRPGA